MGDSIFFRAFDFSMLPWALQSLYIHTPGVRAQLRRYWLRPEADESNERSLFRPYTYLAPEVDAYASQIPSEMKLVWNYG